MVRNQPRWPTLHRSLIINWGKSLQSLHLNSIKDFHQLVTPIFGGQIIIVFLVNIHINDQVFTLTNGRLIIIHQFLDGKIAHQSSFLILMVPSFVGGLPSLPGTPPLALENVGPQRCQVELGRFLFWDVGIIITIIIVIIIINIVILTIYQ